MTNATTVLAADATQPAAPTVEQLLTPCLAGPSQTQMAKLAADLGATPFSDARARRDMADGSDVSVVPDDTTHPDQAQRTEVTITALQGWDLPGAGAGSLEYEESIDRVATVEIASGQPLTPWAVRKHRECRVLASVASAKAIFLLYEKMQLQWYGILVSADRRSLTIFTFDPDAFDIELSFRLDHPLAGLTPMAGERMSRLYMPDADARFANEIPPGVPKVMLRRADLLADLDQPADMHFANAATERVVTRLSAR